MLARQMTSLLSFLVIVSVTMQVEAQSLTEEGDLYSLVLVQDDLVDAQNTMTICDTDENGFIDTKERK